MPRWNLHHRLQIPIATAALLALAACITPQAAAQQHIETSTFNQSPLRPKEDPRTVAHGKDLYDKQCASCHAADMRGVDGKGVNMLRSQDVLTDRKGDNIVPDITGKNPHLAGHDSFNLTTDDAQAMAAYIRTIVAQIGSQGRPPGEAQRSPNIVVGDAAAGKAYFATTCSACHSADKDLQGIATKLSSPKQLQSAWIRGTHLGLAPPVITAKVTEPGKPTVQGTLVHVDDFIVTLKTIDGDTMTFPRNGAVPKVEVNDPLDAHKHLLPVYTDKNIHDVTAYLVTLK